MKARVGMTFDGLRAVANAWPGGDECGISSHHELMLRATAEVVRIKSTLDKWLALVADQTAPLALVAELAGDVASILDGTGDSDALVRAPIEEAFFDAAAGRAVLSHGGAEVPICDGRSDVDCGEPVAKGKKLCAMCEAQWPERAKA